MPMLEFDHAVLADPDLAVAQTRLAQLGFQATPGADRPGRGVRLVFTAATATNGNEWHGGPHGGPRDGRGAGRRQAGRRARGARQGGARQTDVMAIHADR